MPNWPTEELVVRLAAVGALVEASLELGDEPALELEVCEHGQRVVNVAAYRSELVAASADEDARVARRLDERHRVRSQPRT